MTGTRSSARARIWATWHPPRDPRYGCAFGHEHGSNPRAFRYFRRTGMPAFGLVSDYAGSPEAHAGFKVFVANEDRKGLAWMMVLHQGSGSPRRGSVRFHSLETWLFRERGRRMLAQRARWPTSGRRFRTARAPEPRALAPPAGARLPAVLRGVGHRARRRRRVRARPGVRHPQRDHPVRPRRPGAVIFNKKSVCGRADPAGWESRCKGDRRTVFHPRWYVHNGGPSRFRTDAYGEAPGRGSFRWSRAASASISGASATASRTPSSPSSPRTVGSTAPGRGLPAAEGLRVPGLLRAALQLT